MTNFLQQVVSGLASGGIYGLLALAIGLVFGPLFALAASCATQQSQPASQPPHVRASDWLAAAGEAAQWLDHNSIETQQIDPNTPLFRVRSFTLLFITRVASTTAFQMLSVVVGWHVYELTNSALHLGLIGLAQFIAPLLFMVPAGQIVDRYNRRVVLRCCYAVAKGVLLETGCLARSSTRQERPNLPQPTARR